MALGDTLIKLEGKFNDIDRRILRRQGKEVRCFLLKKATESSRLIALLEVTRGHRGKYNDFRQAQRVELGLDYEGLSDTIAAASHFAYGAADLSNSFDVFVIDPDRRDVIPPDGDNPSWKIYGVRDAKVRYSLEVVIPQPPIVVDPLTYWDGVGW